ncbi:acyl carrier protein [Actinomadura terrae]|uniref:acyl carrier protein n=1 Tax=Actinomadura terrae TaxID=604353 RepID=UPI001FA6E248|nr:acyl carrier protein [Actinomadura terrae]
MEPRHTPDDTASPPLFAEVAEVIRAMCRDEPGELSPGTALTDDLGLDSLRLIELGVVLEQRFGLPPVDMDRTLTVRTVGDVVELVRELTAAVRG